MFVSQLIDDAATTWNLSISTLREALKRSGCAKNDINAIIKEASLSFKYIQNLAKQNLSQQEFENQFRAFLHMRWEYIGKTDADYFALPFSPINQLCIKLTQTIVKPEEPLIQILIPSVVITDYDILGESLIDLTEKMGAMGQRELNFSNFILSEDQRAIIPLIQWFEAKIRSGATSCDHLYTQNSQTIKLTESEEKRLANIIMPDSEDFFEKLKEKSTLNTKGTLAETVIEFCKIAHHYGAGNLGASTDQAAEGAYPAIESFFKIWNAIPQSTREGLEKLKDTSYAYELGFYLRYLESRVNPEKHKKELKAFAEVLHSIACDGCIQVVTDRIKGIVDKYIHQFVAIKLDNLSSTPEQVPLLATHLDLLIQSMQKRLGKREQDASMASNCHDAKIQSDAYRPYPENSEKIRWDKKRYYKYAQQIGVTEISILTLSDLELANDFFDQTVISQALRLLSADQMTALLSEALDNDKTAAAQLILKIQPSTGTSLLRNSHSIAQMKKLFCLAPDLALESDVINHCFSLNDNSYNAINAEIESFIVELIEKGASINFNYNTQPLFIHAVKLHSSKIITALIKRHIDINQTNAEGKTALHHVCKEKNKKLADLLIHNGALLNVKDNVGNTALHEACSVFDLKIILLLLEKGAPTDLKNKEGDTPFSLYIKKCSHTTKALMTEDIVCAFVKYGSPLHLIDDMPLIIYAIKKVWFDLLTVLIERKVDLNQMDAQGKTALHYACKLPKDGHKLCQLLLDNGAQVNARDNEGNTPLMLCTDFYFSSNSPTAKCLLEHNADLNVVNQQGKTFLNLLIDKQFSDSRRWNPDIFSHWIARGARVAPTLTPQSTIIRSNHKLMPIFSRAVTPLPVEKELPAHSETLEYALNHNINSLAIVALLKMHSRNELFAINNLHCLIDKKYLSFSELCTLMTIDADRSAQFVLYAKIVMDRLFATAPSHVCYHIRQQKANRIREGLESNNLEQVNHALYLTESRYKFWKTPEAIKAMPMQFYVNKNNVNKP